MSVLEKINSVYFQGISLVPQRSKMDPECDPAILTPDQYDYSEWYKEKLRT